MMTYNLNDGIREFFPRRPKEMPDRYEVRVGQMLAEVAGPQKYLVHDALDGGMSNESQAALRTAFASVKKIMEGRRAYPMAAEGRLVQVAIDRILCASRSQVTRGNRFAAAKKGLCSVLTFPDANYFDTEETDSFPAKVAIKLCEACPLRDNCLTNELKRMRESRQTLHGLATTHGVIGGTTQRERLALLRNSKKSITT